MADLIHRVEVFLEGHPEIDEDAGQQLKDCSPEMQEIVLKRGSMDTAKNKSAALLARIRDARTEVESTAEAPTEEQLEAFFAKNPEIDERAQEELRNSAGYVQRAVIERGKIEGVKNPSGALIARIRDAKQGKGSWQGAGSAPTDEELQAFFDENPEVDERAQEELRNSAAYVQRAVIDRGRIEGVKNPSGSLIARIRDAKQGKGGKGGGGWDKGFKAGMDAGMCMDPWSMMMMMKGGKGGKGGGKGFGGKGGGKKGPYW